ncbi:hypothetical protein [Variovorax sp. dw_308]|uniref:hypothetical protein n=1 Tax=Variovorax sp. dw_308 TaxID=2721546 RepID=UPI001C43AA16|nr:hypothetical protein [Variovorax sp. dw_308]
MRTLTTRRGTSRYRSATTKPHNMPTPSNPAIRPLPVEQKEFCRPGEPDLQPLIKSLRQVPADPMTRMALALDQGGALWSPRCVKKSD